MNPRTEYRIAWWDDVLMPEGWVKMPRAYHNENRALEDLKVFRAGYPEQTFAVLKITTEEVAVLHPVEEVRA